MTRETQPDKMVRTRPRLGGALIFLSASALTLLILILFREIAFRRPALADAYATRIFSPLAAIWAWPSSQFSFSLTEFFARVGPPVLFLLLILGILRLFGQRAHRLRGVLNPAL